MENKESQEKVMKNDEYVLDKLQQEGRINIYSSEYKAIEELILNKYFPGFLHELRICISDKEQLEALLIMIICIHNHLFQLPL